VGKSCRLQGTESSRNHLFCKDDDKRGEGKKKGAYSERTGSNEKKKGRGENYYREKEKQKVNGRKGSVTGAKNKGMTSWMGDSQTVSKLPWSKGEEAGGKNMKDEGERVPVVGIKREK